MKSLREIISENLITLRKKNNLTQIDLSKKINYSDKAISRWEKGEVLPDIETLESISKIYGVNLSYLMEEHDAEEEKEEQKSFTRQEILIHILHLSVIWSAATILYVYLKVFKSINFWQSFVWGIPLSCIYTLFMLKKLMPVKAKAWIQSILVWSLLTCVYLQLVKWNIFLVFLVGLPIQVSIIISAYINKEKQKRLKDNKK